MQSNQNYAYVDYIKNFESAKITELPVLPYVLNYSRTNSLLPGAEAFLDSVNSQNGSFDDDDFLKQKVDLAHDRVNLTIDEIRHRENLTKNNLTRLYEDLLRIDNWRHEKPLSMNYAKDKTWLDFNKMELQIRDQIRRELKDAARDISFPNKDLRNSLLELKVQNQRQHMLNMSDIEMSVFNTGSEPVYKEGDICGTNPS